MSPILELPELKGLRRFYKDQSVAELNERLAARALRARAKEFKNGFGHLTGRIISDEDTEEINRVGETSSSYDRIVQFFGKQSGCR